ncbi:MAG: substrate-binding protein [Planctomycetota bacterium]|jgi:ABC-type branched-subunit amino acid transport system substrate-binding protein
MVLALLFSMVVMGTAAADDVVKVGLNYPRTGPYSVQGLDQLRSAQMAMEEINAAGGVLSRRIELVRRDCQSKADLAMLHVTELIDEEGVKMVFGGATSSVAIAAGRICHEKGVPFFGTLTYSPATTGKEARRYTFRECYNSWMGARALGSYMKENFQGKKYFYVTADYTWGHTTEAAFRLSTGTEDETKHKRILTPFPGATEDDLRKAISFAKMVNPDVLVLVLFGQDMVNGIRQATALGLKSEMQIVVPNLTLGMAEGGGPKIMENVIGAIPWCWKVPYEYDYIRGQDYVERYSEKYNRYPCTSGASAYTILWEWKAACERVNSFEGPDVVRALEGHEYQCLKDRQWWRDWDHQSVQTVYTVRCKPKEEVLKDKYRLDYFEILGALPGGEAVRTREEWNEIRKAAGKPTDLEPLPSE